MEKIALVEKRRLKETRLIVGKIPYKLLNGDVAFPWWEVNFGKQILFSPLWFASQVDLQLIYFTFAQSTWVCLSLSARIITLLVIIY
jgi:hypothetical protein